MGDWNPSCSTFKELPLWNVADVAKSSKDPFMMDVDLGDAICAASSSTQTEDPLSLSSGGTVEELPPIFLATISQHRMPRRKLPSAALGVLPSTSVGDPLSLKEMDPATPGAMATCPQASLGDAILEHTPNTILVSQSPSPHAASKTPDMASISPSAQSQFPSRASPTGLPDEVLCKGQ